MKVTIRAYAQQVGLTTEQLNDALLQYGIQQLTDWFEEEEEADPGSVWWTGERPYWLEAYLPQRPDPLDFDD